MNTLPQELENIILDYTNQLNITETMDNVHKNIDKIDYQIKHKTFSIRKMNGLKTTTQYMISRESYEAEANYTGASLNICNRGNMFVINHNINGSVDIIGH